MNDAITVETEAAPAPPPRRVVAQPQSVHPLGQTNHPARVLWAPADCTIEDLRYAEFWSALPRTLPFRVWDRIEVRAHDRSWRVDVTVVGVRPSGLEVHIDKASHLKAVTEPDDDDGHFTIRCDGGAQPYVILRNKDGSVLPGRHATKDSARLARAQLYARPVA